LRYDFIFGGHQNGVFLSKIIYFLVILFIVQVLPFAAWHTSWRPPGADQLSLRWPKLTLAYDFAAYDSANINIVARYYYYYYCF